MSYKAFEFSLKTEYVFAENAVDALKTQLEKHQPKKPFVLFPPAALTNSCKFSDLTQIWKRS